MKALLLACAAALSLSAATTTTWELNSWQDLVRGRFDGVALDRDGRLTLAPEMTLVFTSGQPAIWSIALAPDGSVYAGTGNRGRVYRIAPDATSSVVWTADQPEVFAVSVAPDGRVYAGSSPDGKLVRLENGKAVDVFAPKAKYIWAVAAAPDGSLFVGTGGPGNVYRVDPGGASELWYETGQEHVTSLAFDNEGRLLAGTEPNGILYRITTKGKAFALYSGGLPEIRTIVAGADGTIYAAAMGGSLAARGGVAQMPVSIASGIGGAAASSTSVTVTDTTSAQAGPDVKIAAKQTAPQQAVQQVLPSLPVMETPGVDKSAVYRINPDNTVETVWSSKDENIYDLVVRPDDSLLVTTDAQGRIYRLSKSGKAALIAQTGEGEGTRLLPTSAGLLAATAETGRLFRLSEQKKARGVYESPVHDAGAVARWGRIAWRNSGHSGNVNFETRTGNSARPDNTWSDWQPLRTSADIQRVQSPNARYIQWRAALDGEATIENISVSYLPQNSPPVIRSILVTTQPGGQSSAQKAAAAASTSTNASFSVTVTDTGDAAPQTSQGTPTQTLSRAGNSQIQISWQADDPEGDRLVYSVWFRGEDESAWKLIRANIFENTLLLDNDAFADGRYLFRVIASDRPSNGPDTARDAELVSSPVLIDNTPPMVAVTAGRRTNNEADLDVEAHDAASSLRRCEYSVDAGPWMPVEAVDGITDSPHAQFHIHVLHLSPGEHLVAIRVYDSAGNAGLAKWVAR